MSAENAWRIAMGAAAEPAYGMATDWWDRAGDYAGADIKRLSERIAALPMPPAFRAEVEAEAEELRGMLHAGLNLCVRARKLDEQADHMLRREMGDQSPEVIRSLTPHLWVQDQYERDLAAWEASARALLSRLETKETKS